MQGIFKIAFRLRHRHVFMWQSVEIFNVFSTVTLKQVYWKTKTFFKKNRSTVFLNESTSIENASFPYKTVISKTTVKTNGNYKMNLSRRTDFCQLLFYFLFWKFCFNFDFVFGTSYKELIWCTNDPNAQIRTFCKCWSFIWQCFFPLSILNKLKWI